MFKKVVLTTFLNIVWVLVNETQTKAVDITQEGFQNAGFAAVLVRTENTLKTNGVFKFVGSCVDGD